MTQLRPDARYGKWTVGLLTGFVALAAFVLAYGGSKSAAVVAGISPAAATWYPLCIEGVIVVSSLGTVTLPGGRQRVLPWTVLVSFTGLSVAANVLHALDHPGHQVWSPGFAAVPPLALPLCVRLAEKVALYGGRDVHAPLGVEQVLDASEAVPVTAKTIMDELGVGRSRAYQLKRQPAELARARAARMDTVQA